MTEQTKTVVLHDDGPPDTDSAADFAAWLSGLIDQAPEDLRPAVKIQVAVESAFGDNYPNIYVYYQRPLTADELDAQRVAADLEAQMKRAHDLEMLRVLRERYPEAG